MKDLKVRFISNFPLSIVYGGFEHQCVQTCKALKSIGVDADLLNWHDAEQNNHILHLFAPDPMWARIVEYWGKRGPVVISAIAGAKGFRRKSYLKNKLINYFTQVLRQETVFSRTRKLLLSVDKIICINPLEQDYFVRTYDLPLKKTAIISHGVDESRYYTSADIFRNKFGLDDFVLYIGNITQRKNPLLLAKCLNQIGLKGVFIGQEMPIEIQYGEAFRNLIANSPNLIWIPGLDYNDPLLSSAFAAARVLCLPSIAETQPLAAMEAMAAGTPIILGNFSYAYQPPFENAVRCNPEDERSIENCIEEVFRSPHQYSRRLPTNFTWENVAAEVLKIYERVLKS